MAAVIEPAGPSGSKTEKTKRIRFGSVEPALLAVMKQLDPLVVVLCLLGCVIAHGGPFDPALGAVCILAFIISSRVFGRAQRDEELGSAPIPTTFYRIVIADSE